MIRSSHWTEMDYATLTLVRPKLLGIWLMDFDRLCSDSSSPRHTLVVFFPSWSIQTIQKNFRRKWTGPVSAHGDEEPAGRSPKNGRIVGFLVAPQMAIGCVISRVRYWPNKGRSVACTRSAHRPPPPPHRRPFLVSTTAISSHSIGAGAH